MSERLSKLMLTFSTIINKGRSVAFGPYLKALTAKWQTLRFKRVWGAVAVSFLLVGSCHDPVGMNAFAGPQSVQQELADLSKPDMMRFSYQLQAALVEDAALLTEMDETKIRLVLAEPDLLRRDGKTRSWQYRTDACVLDVFMTDDSGRIAHYEFRSTDALDEAEPEHGRCLQGLYKDRRIAIEKSFADIYADTRTDDTAG